jgi:hypothetical protein
LNFIERELQCIRSLNDSIIVRLQDLVRRLDCIESQLRVLLQQSAITSLATLRSLLGGVLTSQFPDASNADINSALNGILNGISPVFLQGVTMNPAGAFALIGNLTAQLLSLTPSSGVNGLSAFLSQQLNPLVQQFLANANGLTTTGTA